MRAVCGLLDSGFRVLFKEIAHKKSQYISVSDHKEPLSSIDWTKVSFPSDDVTLGDIRKSEGVSLAEMLRFIADLVSWEIAVATQAMIRETSDRPDRRRVGDTVLNLETEELASHYVEIGLARGRHEGVQLVQKLIASVRAQVHGKSDRGRN
jgi:hypothetical protein